MCVLWLFLFKDFLMKKVIVWEVQRGDIGWTDLTKETLGDSGMWYLSSCGQALVLLDMWMPGQ